MIFSEQRLVRVLAMDVDQMLPEGSAILQRGRCAVDIGSRASLPRENPTQEAFIVCIQITLREPAACRLVLADIKLSADFRLVVTGSDG